MAEGILRSLDSELQVFSAGTEPAAIINPYAVQVMKEIGIDISSQRPKNVSQYLSQPFDYVITVCDNARETCPVFYGEVKNRLHYSIPDPADATGTEEEKLSVYRSARDRLKSILLNLFREVTTLNKE